MRRRTVLLLSLILLILIGAYTMVPTGLKATSSSFGELSNPMVLKGNGTAYVNFSNVIILGVQRLDDEMKVIVRSVGDARVKSLTIEIKLPPQSTLYWRVNLFCGVPVRVYAQNGMYVFDADGIDECGGKEFSTVFQADHFPVRVGVKATARKGLRVYRAEWSFLIENERST